MAEREEEKRRTWPHSDVDGAGATSWGVFGRDFHERRAARRWRMRTASPLSLDSPLLRARDSEEVINILNQIVACDFLALPGKL